MTALTTQHDTGTMLKDSATPHFDEAKCLFCLNEALDLDSNLSHMQNAHGFSIPNLDLLIIDVEALLLCLDSLISNYAQCLYCMTQRHNSLAIKQHMMAKNHCRIDIEDPESEFRDLYHFDTEDEVEQEDGLTASLTHVDQNSVRLLSGKVLTNQKPYRRHRYRPLPENPHLAACLSSDPPSVDEKPAETSDLKSIEKLNRAERRGLALDTQLDQLRQGDRTSLMHLTPSQQRSYLTVTKKQASVAQKAQRQIQGHVQAKGNKFLMKHFSADVKGKMNGIIE